MPIDEIRKYQIRAAELGIMDDLRPVDVFEIRAHSADLAAMQQKRQALWSKQGDFTIPLEERIAAGDQARKLTLHIYTSLQQRRIDRARVESHLAIHEGCFFKQLSGRERMARVIRYLQKR